MRKGGRCRHCWGVLAPQCGDRTRGHGTSRVEGIEQHFVARLEVRAMSLSVEGMGLMALGPAKMIARNFFGEAGLFYEICHKWRELGFRMRYELEIEW